MHLVFLNQYYPPDAAPTGVMLEGVVEELVRGGHEVTVLCASGGYAGEGTSNIEHRTSNIERGENERAGRMPALPENESRDESRDPVLPPIDSSDHQPSTINHQPLPSIIRLRASRFGRGTIVGKLLDYASYYVGVAWKLIVMQPKPDRIVALTTPPLLSVLARLFSKIRGGDHAHWVMDLYPDVMAAHGMLGEKSAGYRILAGLARWGFGGRRCAALLTLGPDMAERVAGLMGTSNIERRTSNIEVTMKEESAGPVSSHHPSTLNHQHSFVQWVPLWGVEVISDQSSECGMSVSELGEAGEAAILHGRRQIRKEKEGDEDIAAPYDFQPSTINSQPSTSSIALRLKRGWGDEELIVMYSGNMGLGHRFGEILEVAALLNIEAASGMNESRDESRGPVLPPADLSNDQPSTINDQPSTTRFVFFGGGRRRVEVEAFVRDHPGCAVEVHDYAPAEELAAHLQSADVHLASLDEAWTGTMVPSKLQGIFAAGRPVIFIGSGASSIGRWVVESGGGWVVREGDVGGLLAALAEARDPEARLTRSRAALKYAATHFDKRTNVARVASILTQQRK